MSLDLVRAFPTVHTLNLGGGYKVARMSDEKATDLREIGEPVKQLFEDFAQETGRELKLEIEPGTFLWQMPAAWSRRCRTSLRREARAIASLNWMPE